MSWFFSKKKKKYYIPREEIVGILELFDRCKENKRSKYALWRKIFNIFPELGIENSDWELNVSNILKPSIQKRRMQNELV